MDVSCSHLDVTELQTDAWIFSVGPIKAERRGRWRVSAAIVTTCRRCTSSSRRTAGLSGAAEPQRDGCISMTTPAEHALQNLNRLWQLGSGGLRLRHPESVKSFLLLWFWDSAAEETTPSCSNHRNHNWIHLRSLHNHSTYGPPILPHGSGPARGSWFCWMVDLCVVLWSLKLHKRL